jgi:hypothetical protein
MKKILNLTAIALLTTTFWSCSYDRLMLFEEEPSVYIERYNVSDVNRDFHVRFFNITGNEMLVPIFVGVTGKLDFENDRPIDFDVVRDSTNAVEGVHFELIKPGIVRAGSNWGYILIRAIRAPDLSDRDEALRLMVVLKPNAYFNTNFQTNFNPQNKRTMDMVHQSVWISDALVQPQLWSVTYLGRFSVKKLLLICQLGDITPAFLDGEPDENGNRMNESSTVNFMWNLTLGRITRIYLEEQAAAGNPVYEDYLDDDGNPVLMTVGAYIYTL